MKEYILPVIGFLVGLASLFIDSKDKKKKWIFVLFLVITVSTTITFNFFESKKKDAALIESKKKEADLTKILLNITTNTNQIPDLVTMLMKFGYTKENAIKAEPDRVNKSIAADKLYSESLAKVNFESTGAIDIKYFPKDVDGAIVINALKDAGFKVDNKAPVNNLPTNAIWAGDDVSASEIRVVALALYRAGVDLISIKRFKDGKGPKSKLIQIGADPANLGKTPKQLNEITNLSL